MEATTLLVHRNEQMKVVARGFTLIELMIVIVIIGILARIAVPQYQSYVQHSRRAEAQSALYGLSNSLERCFTVTTAFNDPRCSMANMAYPVNVPQTGSTPYYTIAITVSTGTTYTIQATRTGIMAGDRCGDYTLTENGTRTPPATGSNSDCWSGS